MLTSAVQLYRMPTCIPDNSSTGSGSAPYYPKFPCYLTALEHLKQPEQPDFATPIAQPGHKVDKICVEKLQLQLQFVSANDASPPTKAHIVNRATDHGSSKANVQPTAL